MRIGKWNVGILAVDTTQKDKEDIALHTQNFLFDLQLAFYYAGRYCEDRDMKYTSKEYIEHWKEVHDFLRECGYFDEVNGGKEDE